MRAGPLDRLITIQRKTSTISASGGVTETWATIANRRPASVRWLRGDERFSTPEIVAVEQVEFGIHYSLNVSDLSPLDRIIYPSLSADSPSSEPPARNIYDVLAAPEIGRHEKILIITQRRPDVTA